MRGLKSIIGAIVISGTLLGSVAMADEVVVRSPGVRIVAGHHRHDGEVWIARRSEWRGHHRVYIPGHWERR